MFGFDCGKYDDTFTLFHTLDNALDHLVITIRENCKLTTCWIYIIEDDIGIFI